MPKVKKSVVLGGDKYSYRYKLGQVVKGNDPKDKEVFGVIGRVMAVTKNTLRVEFRQWGGVYRDYPLELEPPLVLYNFLSKTSV